MNYKHLLKLPHIILLSQIFVSCLILSENDPFESGNGSGTDYGYVWGTVMSVGANSPIAGVLVTCGGGSYTTGADGSYRIDDISVGDKQLTASKTDFENYSKTVDIRKSGTNVNISMVSNIVGASVWGYVRKNADNSPISGAKVVIAGMIDHTDATGRYQLPSIPQGSQNITVEASGYETYSQSFYMYSSDKQININLKQYLYQEFSFTKDNYWSNQIGAGQANSENLYAGEYAGINHVLYFFSNMNMPSNTEVKELKLQLYIENNTYYSFNWKIATINQSWNEETVGQYTPSTNQNFNAPYISRSGFLVTIDIIDAYANNSFDFRTYGFRMIPFENWGYNWSAKIHSSENSNNNNRPKILVSYLH